MYYQISGPKVSVNFMSEAQAALGQNLVRYESRASHAQNAIIFVKFMSGHWLVSKCLSNTHTKNTPLKTRVNNQGPDIKLSKLLLGSLVTIHIPGNKLIPNIRAKSCSQIYVRDSVNTQCPTTPWLVKSMSGPWLVSSCLTNEHTDKIPLLTNRGPNINLS